MAIAGVSNLSLVDYDGYLTYTIFFSGCNFRCPFCHNSIIVTNVLKEDEMSFETIIEDLKKRVNKIDAVCFSGGEPTLEPRLKNFIKQVKALGFLIKLDTNGTRPEVVKDLLDNHLLDYVAMDIKSSLDDKYALAIAKALDLTPIKETINLLKNSSINYEFRTTLVDELHDEETLVRMIEYLKPFPKLVFQHFEDRGRNIKNGLHPFPYHKVKEIIDRYPNLNIETRGYDSSESR